MDFFHILIMGIFGGLCGLLSLIPTLFFENKKTRQIVGFSLFVVIFNLGRPFVLKSYIDFKDPVQSAMSPQMTKLFVDLNKNSRWRDLTNNKSSSEIQLLAQQYAARGLSRLSLKELLEWNDLRLEMAKNDPNFCAGLWTGQVERESIAKALKGLDKISSMRFAQISKKAMILELEKKHPQLKSDESAHEVFAKIGSKLYKDEKQRYFDILSKGVSVENEDACWIMSKIMIQIPHLSQLKQKRIFATLTSQN